METRCDKWIILYDGVCGLCNRFNLFVLRRDRHDRFRFASLQSEFAKTILSRYGKDPHDLDTLYLVEDHERPAERLKIRSEAVLSILARLGGIWKVSAALKALPRLLLDAGYNWIARNRYRIFGKYDACPLPDPKWKEKFVEV